MWNFWRRTATLSLVRFFFHFHSFFKADHIAVAEIKDSDDGCGDERMMTILDSWMPQSTSSDDPEDTGQASSE